jgi:hypothetical protein
MLCKKKNADGESEKTGEDQGGQQFVGLNFDYKKDYVVRCLNANKHNHITTSYYLLLKRYQELGQISQSDFTFFDDKAIIKLIKEQNALEKRNSVPLP